MQIANCDFEALRMLRALRRAEGFALYFAVCNVPVHRAELVEEIRRNLHRPIVEVAIPSDADDPYPPIEEALNGRTNSHPVPEDAVVFIYGLERLIPSADLERARRTLSRLNWKRSAYRRLGRPLVFWIPLYLIPLLAGEAPDFWDWHSGLYEFPLPEAVRGEVLTRLTEGAYWTARALSVEEKREQIRLLEGLLDEYRGDDVASLRARKETLRRLGEFYYSLGKYDAALKSFREHLSVTEKLDDRAGLAESYNNIGLVYKAQGDYELALEYHGKALAIRKEIGDRAGLAESYNNIGAIYYAHGNYEWALEYYEKALAIREEIGDRMGLIATYNNIGEVYRAQGDYGQALEYYRKALAIQEEIGDRAGLATTYNNIGEVYRAQGDYERALEYHRKALVIREEVGDRAGLAVTYNNIGLVYRAQGDYKQALRYYERALKLFEILGMRLEMAVTYHNMGLVALAQGDRERTSEWFRRSRDLYRELGLEHEVVEEEKMMERVSAS